MGGKTKTKDMIVTPKTPKGLKVGDLIYYDRQVRGGEYFKIYALTKRVVLDGETWFRARRVLPRGVCLNEDDESIVIGGILHYKILNI
jgi:hypothetical protein